MLCHVTLFCYLFCSFSCCCLLPVECVVLHLIVWLQFLHNSTGFQCTRELCSRLRCWCGSVLTALLPAASPNSAFLLPLLHGVSISVQPRRAYYKFPEPKPRSAGGASLSQDHLCGIVFLLLYRDQRWLCTLSRDNWRPICSTSDVLTNRRNIHYLPALLFSWFWHQIQNCRLTYLHTCRLPSAIVNGHIDCVIHCMMVYC